MKGLFKAASTFLTNHGDLIRTGVSIGSTLLAVYFAAKDSPKLMAKLDELRDSDKSNLEKAKEVGPIVARTALATAVSIGCQVAGHKKLADANNTIQSLASAYQVASIAKEEIEKKTEEIAGPEVAQKVREAVSMDHAQKSYGSGAIEHIIDTGHGNNVFYDDWSGAWFYSDINFVKKCINDLNYQLMHEMSISEGEFYSYLDIPSNKIGKHVENSGWNIDDGQIDVEYYAKLDDCDQAYTVMSFRNPPKANYYSRRWG